jgi:hypothetical protein
MTRVGRDRSFRTSEDLDRVGDHPDVDLLEIKFEAFLKVEKPCAVFGRICHVGEYPHEVIAIDAAFMLPDAPNSLRLERCRAEAPANSDQRLADQVIGNRRPIVKAQWKQDLVAARTRGRKASARRR